MSINMARFVIFTSVDLLMHTVQSYSNLSYSSGLAWNVIESDGEPMGISKRGQARSPYDGCEIIDWLHRISVSSYQLEHDI